MNGPEITVCIIDYNYGHFLAGAIESALAQDVPAKVIVVDDGSTDNSRSVGASFGDRVRYYWKPNGGLSDARNFGLERCDTPYLLFLDADDRLPPEFLRVTHQALDHEPDAAFAYVQMTTFTDDSDLWDPTAEVTRFPDFSAARLKRGNYITSAALLRRNRMGGVRYDTRLRHGLEDWEFFISLAERGERGVLVEGTNLRYRTHGTSMGQTLQRRDLARRLTYLYVIAKHWRFFGLSGSVGFARRSLRSRLPATTSGRAQSEP